MLATQTQGASAAHLAFLPFFPAIPRKSRIPGVHYLVAHPDGGPGTSGVARRHERLRGHKRGSGLGRGEAARSPRTLVSLYTLLLLFLCGFLVFFCLETSFLKKLHFKREKKKRERCLESVFLDIFSVGLLFESVFDIGNTR